jgi:uncharacterized surface protein with fasciclin (FAS1) repeats
MRKLVALLTLALLVLGIVAPVVAQDDGVAHIRVAHLAAAPATVIVFLNGEVALSGLRAGRVSAWREVPAGTHTVQLGTTSGDPANAFFGPLEIEVAPGSFVTLSTLGSDDTNTADLNEYQVVSLDQTDLYAKAAPPGAATVSFFHAVEGAAVLDVWSMPTPAEPPAEGEEAPSAAQDGERIVNALGFPGSFFTAAGPMNDGRTDVVIPAGTYDLQFVPNGFREPVVIDAPGFEVAAGDNILVVARGSADAPDLAVVRGPANEFVTGNIVETAQSWSDLSTLVLGLQAADPAILEALAGPGPFTVFAPTDDAFAAAMEALGMSAEDVLGNQELLNTVLRYHIVSAAGGGAIHSSELGTRGQILTLANEFISAEGGVLNGSVNVVTADVPATNGIIHVIDGVLLPPSVVAAMAGEGE